MPTTGIIEALNDDKEAPWADWKHGMTAEKMGRILKTFGVKSEQRQEDGSRHRGYSGGALQPIFDRYLSSSGSPSVENGSQPVQSPANQVLEPLQHCTGSSVEPVHAQAKNLNLCTAKPLPEPIGEQMHGIDLKKEGDCKHSLNGSGSHEPSPTKRLPNLAPDEQRLIYALAPHDYDGGLAYGDLQKKTGLPEWSFASVVKSLLHRDLVYYSPLDHNYHLTASLAEALIARASPRGGVKTSPGKWFP